MRTPDPIVASWMSEYADVGLEVVRFGDVRGDATVVAVPPPAPALLHDLWVHPDHRRQGVARRLVTDVCAWADERQRTLHLVAAEDVGTIALFDLVAFYRSHGFRVGGWMDPQSVAGAAGVELARSLHGYTDPRPVMTRYPQAPAATGR